MNRRIVFLVVAVGITAFVIGYGMTALAFTTGAAPADVVMVPDVRVMPVDDAEREMADVGLALAVGDSFPNPDVPAGAILTQSPLPGQEVSPGVEVTVIISTGPRRPLVPDVTEMPLTLAVRALQTAGFDVVVQDTIFQDSLALAEPGSVVAIEPAPGTPLRLPASVRVLVGQAATVVAMPSLIGMLEENAREIIEGLGLELTEVLYPEARPNDAPGVIWQEPPPGDSIDVGSTVRLQVIPGEPDGGSPPAQQGLAPGPSTDAERDR